MTAPTPPSGAEVVAWLDLALPDLALTDGQREFLVQIYEHRRRHGRWPVLHIAQYEGITR
jgi:hypothetical protein